MYVFIDTNIFLSFYLYASDDLDQLRKLLDAIKKGGVILVLPDQVRQEFWRNREAKIADALSRLKDQKLELQFPQICKDSAYYPDMRATQKEYRRLHGLLLKEITNAANLKQLKADELIEELFKIATPHHISDPLISRAQLRVRLGNPPGKNGSLGDAINWEVLLEQIPDGNDVYIISSDRDFRSAIDDVLFSPFLASEWEKQKSSRVQYYSQLSAFFKDYYPSIRLAVDKEIEDLTIELETSGTFSYTHYVIAKFNQYTEFTDEQVNRIVGAIVSNNQVYWIIGDEDVNQFARRIIHNREGVVDPEHLRLLSAKLGEAEEVELPNNDTDDIPF